MAASPSPSRRPLDIDASPPSPVRRFVIESGRTVYHRLFRLLERSGVHLVPNHFYGPVPDTRELSDRLWTRPSDAVGVDFNEPRQIELLEELRRYKPEYDVFPLHPTGQRGEYYVENDKFGAVDAAVLYGIVRSIAPRQILEVGSGFSTMAAAAALQRNSAEGRAAGTVDVIDPYPHVAVQNGFPGLGRVIRERVQDVPLAEFERLTEGDILFIDTSHVLKTGSDVQYEFLEVLPRLAPGVWVHVHDIFMPAEYPREWVLGDLTFWNEQYLLQAFLAFNRDFEVIWAGQYMHLRHSEELRDAFALYDGLPWVGSFWMRRVS